MRFKHSIIVFSFALGCNFQDLELDRQGMDDMGSEVEQDMLVADMSSDDMFVPDDLGGNVPQDMTIPDMMTPQDQGGMDMPQDMLDDLTEMDQGSGDPMCGNGVLEAGELCDGNCPTSCDDGNMCTRDIRAGDASTCDAICTNPPISACTNDDGCCPSGCTSSNDNDCAPVAIDCTNEATWPAAWKSTASGVKPDLDSVQTRGSCNGQSYPPRPVLARNDQLDQVARCVTAWMEGQDRPSAQQVVNQMVADLNNTSYTGNGVSAQVLVSQSSNLASTRNLVVGSDGNCQVLLDNKWLDVGIAYTDMATGSSGNHVIVVILGAR